MFAKLYTSEGRALKESGSTPWNIYPRPQLRRDSFLNLNGSWDFCVRKIAHLPEFYDKKILVPFCPESMLSGLDMEIKPGSYMFYRTCFTLPNGFLKDRVLLHIGAADQVADIYVNGTHICSHRGGYDAFSADITDALIDGENQLVLRVSDDLRDLTLPYGKQSLTRGGMWYTPVSGIWQTVWLESVPEHYITGLDIRCEGESVRITVENTLNGVITVKTPSGSEIYPLDRGVAEIAPKNPRLWSPEEPYLYEFTVETATDRVESYFALRSLETKVFDGIPRLCLNGKPYFFHGLLDQGYWSDGLFTPAEPECYEQDVLTAKGMGFNTLRKHIKVEPEAFYYACDRLGMIVFQDMVNNSDYSYIRDTILPTVGKQKSRDKRLHKDPAGREAFLTGMENTVRQLKNHPCIVYWTIFNEGWGQFDSDNVYHKLRNLDDTRFIDSTSGWFRRKETDVDSRHIYFGPWGQLKASDKPLVLSEFGGHCYAVENHLFNPEKAYGYKTCKTPEELQASLDELYRVRIIPAIQKGLCGAILTQISDVEDEINGLVTYDREVVKVDPVRMRAISRLLNAAFEPVGL